MTICPREREVFAVAEAARTASRLARSLGNVSEMFKRLSADQKIDLNIWNVFGIM